jgi:hypothetical protein
MNIGFSQWLPRPKMPFSINFVPIGWESSQIAIAHFFGLATDTSLPRREQEMSDQRPSSHHLESLPKLGTQGDGTGCRCRHRRIAHVAGVLESRVSLK